MSPASPDPDRPPERPDLYVVARFLDRLHAAPEGFPRTRLQAAVRLNYDLYRRYLGLLTHKRWAQVAPDKEGVERVHLTPEGRAAHARLVGWLRDALGELDP